MKSRHILILTPILIVLIFGLDTNDSSADRSRPLGIPEDSLSENNVKYYERINITPYIMPAGIRPRAGRIVRPIFRHSVEH